MMHQQMLLPLLMMLSSAALGQICANDPEKLYQSQSSISYYDYDCDPSGSQLEAVMLFEPPSVPFNYSKLCVLVLQYGEDPIPGKLVLYEVDETPSTSNSFKPKPSPLYVYDTIFKPQQEYNYWWWYNLPNWIVTKPRVFIGISFKTCEKAYVGYSGKDVGTLSGQRLWYIRANSSYNWATQTYLRWDWRWGMMLRAEGEALPAGWVPEEWTCAEDDYKDGSVCNCECGTFDPDCLHSALSANCSDDQACTSEGTCIDLGWEAAGLCTAADYGTRNGCQCCGPSGKYDLDCYDYSQYTYCSDGVPGACDENFRFSSPSWDCPLDKWNDGVCDCGCHPPDIDCFNASTTNDCSTGECDPFFGCFDSGFTCKNYLYDSDDGCHCDCGALDPDCKITNQTLDRCDSEFSSCNAAGLCAVATCGNDWVDSLFQGDPDLGEEEECDGGTGCTACKCDEGFYPFEPVRQLGCYTVCNDSIVAGAEQCDGGVFCTDCMCDPQHDAYNPPRLYCSGCGNGFVDPGEECDGSSNCTSACLCESGLVSFNGTCSALLPPSSSSSLPDQTTPSSSTTDQLAPSSSSGKKPKSLVGPIVGGILGGIAGLAVAGALVFVGWKIHRKRQGIMELTSPHGVEMQAASSPMTTGGSSGSSTSPSTSARHTVVIPHALVAAAAAVSTQAFDPVAAGAKLVGDEGRWRLSEQKLMFGLNGEQAPIGVKLKQTFELLNERDKKVSFQAIGRECNQYSLVIAPPSGVVKGMYGMSLTAELTLHCSAVVNTPIVIMLTFSEGDKELKEYRMLDVEVQGKLSTRIDLDEIEIQGVVGEGSFGVVSRGTWRGNEVAVKELKRTLFENEPSAVTDFIREVEMLEQLRAPQIITFFGAVFVPGHLCLVTEFCPLGSLERVLRHYNTSLLLRLRFAIDCSKGMNFLHKSRILHRDLKLENLLVVSIDVESPVLCKISDFGTSRGVAGKADMHLTRGLGTPICMAPEIMSQSSSYTTSADVYSFGVMLWQLYTCKQPYEDEHFVHSWDVARFVMDGHRMTIPEDCPPKFRDLIATCWDQNSERRPSFEQVLVVLEGLAAEARASGLDATNKRPKATEKCEHAIAKTVATASIIPDTAATVAPGTQTPIGSRTSTRL